MIKIVNADSRRVNSRRVGGAVHLESLILRAKGAVQEGGFVKTLVKWRRSCVRGSLRQQGVCSVWLRC